MTTARVPIRISGTPTSVTITYLYSTVRPITGHTTYPLNFTMFQYKRDNTKPYNFELEEEDGLRLKTV
jgi:hypothetical protein